jgi:chromosome partitioning protein
MAVFLGDKGGVGKSTLARVLAVGAAHRGQRTLLADFDVDQMTCLEWGAARLLAALRPRIEVRGFTSLATLRAEGGKWDFVVVDTRGRVEALSMKIAEWADVIFVPTGVAHDDLGPTLAVARMLARRGVAGRFVAILSRVGRSESQFVSALRTISEAGFEVLTETWPQRDGFQIDLDAGRAGRESRNPYLRDIAIRTEEALWTRVMSATQNRERQ